MWYNPLMTWLLRSPLHSLIDRGVMLISYQGRKSGKRFSVPVNYVEMGKILLTVSFRRRNWWRNLRGGASVTLLLRGCEMPARSDAIEDDECVSEHLTALIGRNNQYAKFLNVTFDAQGHPDLDAVRKAAQERVIILTQPGA
jgi:hypothetical protein